MKIPLIFKLRRLWYNKSAHLGALIIILGGVNMVIALVEDEKDLSKVIKKYLENEGYKVVQFFNGEDAFNHIRDGFDLWILDIMLPGEINGYDLIRSIRNYNKKTAVIFTSARDQDIDKIMGLELGSDDYIAKPYSPRELVLRVKALFNRINDGNDDKLEYGPYKIDYGKRIVMKNDEAISLTTKEFELLKFLLKHPNQAFSRDQILDGVWGSDYFGSDRVVDDLMRRLRQKMPELEVETIYGYGYRLL